MRRFEGQVAIVTGAARGIGLGVARKLGSEGARIVMMDKDEFREIVESVRRHTWSLIS